MVREQLGVPNCRSLIRLDTGSSIYTTFDRV